MIKKGVLGALSVDSEKMALINKFTKRELEPDEVYAFSVVLCDNDIDRDFERFTNDALDKLAELYIGKTGIFDHSMKAENQVARIFSTRVERVENQKNALGEPYVRLIAEAYIPRTPKNEELILSLDAGIHKEVSVGCAVGKRICSVCGTDTAKEFCGHKKGKVYTEDNKNQQCHILLCEPYDAYEWSFVAVPAQRRAGVVKAFKENQKEEIMETEKIIKSLGEGEITLSENQAKALKTEIEGLQKIASAHNKALRKSCMESIMLHLPESREDNVSELLSSLSTEQLTQVHKLFATVPESVQTASEKGKNGGTFEPFVI